MSEGKTILLVDDERSWLFYLTLLLKHPQVALMTTTSSEQALELLVRFKPDLVITDTNMPRVSGIKLLEESKRIYPQIPVIVFFSGLVNSNLDKNDVVSMGADLVLAKFESELLPTAVSKFLNLNIPSPS